MRLKERAFYFVMEENVMKDYNSIIMNGQGTVLSLWRIDPSQSNLNCASKRKYDSQPKIQKINPHL